MKSINPSTSGRANTTLFYCFVVGSMLTSDARQPDAHWCSGPWKLRHHDHESADQARINGTTTAICTFCRMCDFMRLPSECTLCFFGRCFGTTSTRFFVTNLKHQPIPYSSNGRKWTHHLQQSSAEFSARTVHDMPYRRLPFRLLRRVIYVRQAFVYSAVMRLSFRLWEAELLRSHGCLSHRAPSILARVCRLKQIV